MGKDDIKFNKTIALIAHDNRKRDLLHWVKNNIEVLKRYKLCGTGTTSTLISKETGLNIFKYESGPMGGDQQIGAAIVKDEIQMMIFFSDPLTPQAHEPDVKALIRIGVIYDIPMAMNEATANLLLSTRKLDDIYERKIVDYTKRLKKSFL